MNPGSILVPLDGSPLAEGVLPYAESLAHLTRAGIRLVTILEPLDGSSWGMTGAARERVDEAQRDAAQHYLDGLVRALEARGVSATGCILTGDAAERIVEAGRADDVALITMSTHGRGGVQRLLLGSVADKVLRLGTRSTFLVRTAESDSVPQPVVFKRMLVPLDGSALAEQALLPAARLARAAHATIVLARAERHLWQTMTWEVPMVGLPELDDEVTASITRYLEQIRGQLQTGATIELAPRRGYPSVVLEELALAGNIDLVVMTTHGRGGLRRMVVGSMADRMVRLGAPTLLVRPVAVAAGAASDAR